MRTPLISFIIAASASASLAHAQSPLQNAILELRIVPVNGSLSPGIYYSEGTIHDPVLPNSTARTRRFEVQYRITDPDNAGSRGLFSMLVDVQFLTTGGAVSLAPHWVSLSRFQGLGPSMPPPNPDRSGAYFTGCVGSLHFPFRGGVPAPCPSANAGDYAGRLSPTGISQFGPLALQPPNHVPGTFYGLYSFTIDVGPAPVGAPALVAISTRVRADVLSGQRWVGFVSDNPFPQTSANVIEGHASFIVLPVGACAGDFDHSGSISLEDLFAFIRAYLAHNPSADVNASGGVTVEDIFDFLTAYFTPCA